MAAQNAIVFEDFFPAMVEKLGAEGFMKELINGFRLLMDGDKGMITFESLKRNLALLGLQDMTDEELVCMLREGDLNGDGALDEMEFCTLMFRLSPALMKSSRKLLVEALINEILPLTDALFYTTRANQLPMHGKIGDMQKPWSSKSCPDVLRGPPCVVFMSELVEGFMLKWEGKKQNNRFLSHRMEESLTLSTFAVAKMQYYRSTTMPRIKRHDKLIFTGSMAT
ncbi:hypothetical protein QQP08_018955 [Theobroma cacao]|nr:hypothetical protein QQP08_018955 [Theobroma cacao]